MRNIIFLVVLIYLIKIPISSAQNISVPRHLHIAFELDGYKDDYLFKKAEKLYLQILEKDSLDIQANYGLGSLYNNYAIYYQSQLNDTNNINNKRLQNKIAEKGIKYYELSLPYLTRYNKLSKQNEMKK